MYQNQWKRRIASVVLASCLILTGCGSSQTTETQENTIAVSESTITGTVSETDGTSILLTVSSGGGMGGGQMPSGGDMGGGQMPSGEGMEQREDMPDGEAPDDAPDMDGAFNGEVPDDEVKERNEEPSGGETPDIPGEQESSGITLLLTIADESILQTSEGESASLSDIAVGDTLTVVVDDSGIVSSVTLGSSTQDPGMGGTGGMSSGVDSYAALQEFTEDAEISGETYASTGTDENAIHIYNGATVTLSEVKATRDSADSTGGDNSSFYGVGADVLATDGTVIVEGGEYTTDADGGAGIFAYDSGIAYVSDAKIMTSADTSGGIHAAGGGTLYAWDLDVETSGESSAAIRSDRGGGTMVVDGGSYVSNGTGSPAVYCTADIAVNDSTLTANGSEGICIEGLNTLHLYDCDLTTNMQDDEQNDCTWSIIVYQSMSGDSEVGNSTFHMVGGSITSNNGGLIYTTNTESTMLLSGVDITYADDCEFFLRCTGNANARGWGQTGSNGSQCSFTADAQEMAGDVIYDSISELDFYMMNGSTLTGAFVDDETYAGDGGDGFCNVYISADSTWVVTGDSVVTALYQEGTIVDENGDTVSIVGSDGTVYVDGTSSYTVTVDSYDTTADFSGASEAGSFADYEVSRPDAA